MLMLLLLLMLLMMLLLMLGTGQLGSGSRQGICRGDYAQGVPRSWPP